MKESMIMKLIKEVEDITTFDIQRQRKMNEIERAIALFESSYNPEDATTEYNKLKQQVFAIAIEVLKEKLERENDIVYCKDCKHLGIKDFIYGYCKRDMSGQVQPDDYCSRGVRRKERSNERD